MLKNIWGGIIGFGQTIGSKIGTAAAAASKSKRFWTVVFTAGLKAANLKFRLIDEATLNELVGLAVAAIVSDSLRPIGEPK